jgi:hypothetical protein
MRHVFLALFAIFCYTTAMCYEPDEGYSREQRVAMDRLVADSIEPKDWLTELTEVKHGNH